MYIKLIDFSLKYILNKEDNLLRSRSYIKFSKTFEDGYLPKEFYQDQITLIINLLKRALRFY